MMGTFWQDVKYAARMLARSPGVTAVAVLSLALGIGANTTIFAVVNSLLLRPLPAERPEEIVFLYTSDFSGPLYGTSSVPDYEDFRERTRALSGLAGYTITPFSLEIEEQAEEMLGEIVSGNYFQVLGLRPALGRAIQPADDVPGAEPVVVLGYQLWQSRFGGDPGVVGSRVRLNGQSIEVIGVAPAEYSGMLRMHPTEVWAPLAQLPLLSPGSNELSERGSRGTLLFGRLRPGVSFEQAQAEFGVLAQQQHAAYPETWRDVRGEPRVVTLVPESEARIPPAFRGNVVGFLALLMGVVGLVLLIACANVANVLLARAAGRRREIAIRLALGAGRGRLVRQLLTESTLLALLAAAAGLLLALWGTEAAMAFKPPVPIPLAVDLGFDARVLGFTFVLALLTGVLFGLAPALGAARTALVSALKEEGNSSAAGGRTRLRSAFVIVQVTLSLVLLVGAGLFVRSLRNATLLDPGFDPQGALVGSFNLRLHGYDEVTGTAFYRELHQRLRALPGVEAASLVAQLPLGMSTSRRSVTIEGYTPQPGEDMEIATTNAGPDYFAAMRIPLRRGRGFTDRDLPGAPRVVVVNETFARRYWPGQDPLGKRIWMGRMRDGSPMPAAQAWEIVGVAGDGKYGSLGEDPRPFFYLPLLQFYRPAATLVVRTPGNPRALADAVVAEVRALHPALPLVNVTTLVEHMDISLLAPQIAASVLGLFGAVALLLASVGLYGVMAYTVAQRTREIGIRIALGAGRGDILGLVLRQGMTLVAAGVALGLAGAAALTRLVGNLLHGISPYDAVTFAGVAVLLAAVAAVACWIPARRATRVDPLVALRYE